MKKNGPSKRKRIHMVYQGRVQGIGFRFTAERLAMDCGVTGWVKNLPEGDVELVAEGEEGSLKMLIEEIQSSVLGRYIQKTQALWEPYCGEFSEFRIEYFI